MFDHLERKHDIEALSGLRQLGNTAGAIVASRVACSEAMPKLGELEAALV